MLDAMPSKLFAEWMAFYAVEPYGAQADAIRASVPITWLSRWLGNKNPKLADFMPRFEKKPKRSSGAQVKAICIGMARSFKKKGTD